MSADDNTVNIKRRSYHHGDLRRVLLTEGLRLLAERDAETLSLREMARAAGVSATSVYRHFPDKEALMAALADEGFARLGAAQRAASAAAGDAAGGFAATGRTYVRFALANPALFRLMFATPVPSGTRGGRLEDTEPGAMLRRNAAVEAARLGGDADLRAVQAWALVHGLAMLMLDGRLPPDESLIDAAIG